MARDAQRGSRRDFMAPAGIAASVGLILAGQAIEGGTARTLLHLSAAMIVFGGTAGAVLVSFASADVRQAGRAVVDVFKDRLEPSATVIARIVRYAVQARQSGVMSIDPDLDREPDRFLRRALTMAVDGATQTQIRGALEIEMDTLDEREEIPARVFEAAGGYAPTLGILGAVIGLIHVMENLSDPTKLGPGIAVAFVATVYGVGSANLIFLPVATKLRQRARAAARRRDLLLDGVLSIQDGLNPRLIQQRLGAFSDVDDAAAPARLAPARPLRERAR